MRETKAENHDRTLLKLRSVPLKNNEFSHFYGRNFSFGTKKTSVDKSGPYDRQRKLMSFQGSLMPPRKPQVCKTGGLLKTDREALSSSENFII